MWGSSKKSKTHTPPPFCEGCGRPVRAIRVLDFEKYDPMTGEPLNPRVTPAFICESAFDRLTRHQRIYRADFGLNCGACYQYDGRNGRPKLPELGWLQQRILHLAEA